jgi:adenylyltransferase/sulfurtransferase
MPPLRYGIPALSLARGLRPPPPKTIGIPRQTTKLFAMFDPNFVREISVQELKRLQDEKADIQIVDVREPDETAIATLNGLNIPLGQIDVRTQELDRQKPVIFHCKSGRRSEMAVLFLQQQHGFENLYNLKGGILAYALEIDPNLSMY